MNTADQYRAKAAQLGEQAKVEPNLFYRGELTTLAVSYLRLAEEADRSMQANEFDETSRLLANGTEPTEGAASSARETESA